MLDVTKPLSDLLPLSDGRRPADGASWAFRDAVARAVPSIVSQLAGVDDSDARSEGVESLRSWAELNMSPADDIAHCIAEEFLFSLLPLLSEPSVAATAVRVLLAWLRAGGLSALIACRKIGDKVIWGALGAREARLVAAALAGIPDRVANGAAMADPPFAVPSVMSAQGYYALLEVSLCEAAEAVESLTNRDYSTNLVVTLCRRARGHSLGAAWAFRRQAAGAVSARVQASWLSVFLPSEAIRVLSGAVEAVFVNCLDEAAAGGPLEESSWVQQCANRLLVVLGSASSLPSCFYDAVIDHFLLCRALPGFCARALVRWLGDALPLERLLETWASESYTNGVGSREQASAGRALAAALMAAPGAAFSVTSKIPSLVMEGVGKRLDHADPLVRLGGLVVAEAFGPRVAMPGQSSLDFVECRESDEEYARFSALGSEALAGPFDSCKDDVLITKSGDVPLSAAAARVRFAGAAGASAVLDSPPLPICNNDEEISAVTSIGSAGDGQVSENRSLLLPAPTTAEELERFKMAALAAATVGEAYAALLAWSQDASLRGEPVIRAHCALSMLPTLVRDAAEGADDDDDDDAENEADDGATGALSSLLLYAGPLSTLLLTLEDSAGWGPAFDEWRYSALTALAAAAPHIVVPSLLSRVGGREVGESARFDALNVLVAAARELSGAGESTPPVPLPPWADPTFDTSGEPDDTPGAAEELAAADKELAESSPSASASALRAFSSAGAKSAVVKENFFSQVAAVTFFWPLWRLVTGASISSSIAAARAAGSTDDALSAVLGDAGIIDADPSLIDLSQPIDLLGSSHARLLAQSLNALAVFAEAAGKGTAEPLARALLPIAWDLRDHTNGNVRLAALTAAAAVVSSIAAGGDSILMSPSVLNGPRNRLEVPRMHHNSVDSHTLRRELTAPGSVGGALAVLSSVGSTGAASVSSSLREMQESEAATKSYGAAAANFGRALPSSLDFWPSQKKSAATLNAASAAALLHSSRGAGDDVGALSSVCVWDDLVELASWCQSVVSSASTAALRAAPPASLVEPDSRVRAKADAMLRGPHLRNLVLAPIAALEDSIDIS